MMKPKRDKKAITNESARTPREMPRSTLDERSDSNKGYPLNRVYNSCNVSTNTCAASKRKRANEAVSKANIKRVKGEPPLNSAPTQILDIYVFGDGESGELGLGPISVDGLRPTNVKYPRRNKLLSDFGIVQIAVGGMHCVALTHDQKIVTWGVNDNGALGRDTIWEAPTRDIDYESNSEDSEGENDLNPKESTPTAIPQKDLGNGNRTFAQVAATDSASFALTSDGLVWGWGTFCVLISPTVFREIL